MVVRWLDGLSFEEVFEFHFFGGMEASRVERIFVARELMRTELMCYGRERTGEIGGDGRHERKDHVAAGTLLCL